MTRTLMLLGALTLIACPGGGGGMGGLGGGGGGGGSGSAGGSAGLSAQCRDASYGEGSAAMKVHYFLQSAHNFTASANQLSGSLKDVCARMGSELGMSSGELSGDVRAVCQAVSAKMRSEMSGLRAEANFQIEVVAEPPRCEVSVDAYAECVAECDVNVDPGSFEVECEGGYIAGQCSATCQGECSVDVQGACNGTCEGTCTAGCQGTCNGTCEGECSARNAQGECTGTCSGTCHGTCEGGCNGGCEGECWVSGQASCSGECRGGCSVEYQEPRCTGEVRAPSADADCSASCDANFSAQAECEPGRAEVYFAGDVSSNMQDKADRVRAAISAGWGELQMIKRKLKIVASAGQQLVDATRNLRGVGRQVAAATMCMAEAVTAVPAAMSQVSVSLEVSVEVSASASASAG